MLVDKARDVPNICKSLKLYIFCHRLLKRSICQNLQELLAFIMQSVGVATRCQSLQRTHPTGVAYIDLPNWDDVQLHNHYTNAFLPLEQSSHWFLVSSHTNQVHSDYILLCHLNGEVGLNSLYTMNIMGYFWANSSMLYWIGCPFLWLDQQYLYI